MFINISNHPLKNWSSEQIRAAIELSGDEELIDFPFPNVDPTVDEGQVLKLAEKTAASVMDIVEEARDRGVRVKAHVMGQQMMAFFIVMLLMNRGVDVYESTTERKALEEIKEDGSIVKTSVFKFVRFREYILPFCVYMG